MIADEELAEWKRLGEAAAGEDPSAFEESGLTGDNVRFLFVARAAVPALIAEVERLRAELEQARREERARATDALLELAATFSGNDPERLGVVEALTAIRALT